MGYCAMGRMELTAHPLETGLPKSKSVSHKNGEGLVPEQIKT